MQPKRQIRYAQVSVLFSEPKIPQSPPAAMMARDGAAFQCSSASRKFLNRITSTCVICASDVSVLFSEPKIPQFKNVAQEHLASECFSALQRAENSSMLCYERVSVI